MIKLTAEGGGSTGSGKTSTAPTNRVPQLALFAIAEWERVKNSFELIHSSLCTSGVLSHLTPVCFAPISAGGAHLGLSASCLFILVLDVDRKKHPKYARSNDEQFHRHVKNETKQNKTTTTKRTKQEKLKAKATFILLLQ